MCIDYDLEFKNLDADTEIEIATLSHVLKNASRLSAEKLSENLQKECVVRKAVCDKVASIYTKLFGERREETENVYSFWEFCDQKWDYEWSRKTLLEIESLYIECEASIKAIIEVNDEEILEGRIEKLIKKSSYVKPQEIFEYIDEKISESVNNVFEEYATFDDYYPPIMEDYDTIFEEAMKDCLAKFGIEVFDFAYYGYTSNYMS